MSRKLCTLNSARAITITILIFTITYNSASVLQFGFGHGMCDLEGHYHYFNVAKTRFVMPILCAIIPSVTIGALNLATGLRLYYHKSPSTQSAKSMRKATKVVMTISITYLILSVTSTAAICSIRDAYFSGLLSPFLLIVYYLAVLLGMCNHAVNFFLYIMVSKQFQQKLILCRRSNAVGQLNVIARRGDVEMICSGAACDPSTNNTLQYDT